MILFPILNFAQCEVKGNIKIVNYGQDYKVRKIGLGDNRVNLKVKIIEFGNADKSGEWKIVAYGEDFTIKFVDYGEDFTIQFVDYNQGCGKSSRNNGAYSNPGSNYNSATPSWMKWKPIDESSNYSNTSSTESDSGYFIKNIRAENGGNLGNATLDLGNGFKQAQALVRNIKANQASKINPTSPNYNPAKHGRKTNRFLKQGKRAKKKLDN
jgi:hypothetical protein